MCLEDLINLFPKGSLDFLSNFWLVFRPFFSGFRLIPDLKGNFPRPSDSLCLFSLLFIFAHLNGWLAGSLVCVTDGVHSTGKVKHEEEE